jgi:uncharacterized protein YozE (UPF0346 family)
MNKLLALLSATFLLCTSVEASYMPFSHIEMDSDFIVIGNVEKIETKTAVLRCSHMMRNLSRQPEKREEKEFQIILSGDEIELGNHGIWVLHSQNKASTVFSAKKLPKDYPDYDEIGELIRTKDYLFQGSEWVGIWKADDSILEVYLGESRSGYIKENGNLTNCMWIADIERNIASIYRMTTEGKYEKYGFIERLDSKRLFWRSKDINLTKVSDNQAGDDNSVTAPPPLRASP